MLHLPRCVRHITADMPTVLSLKCHLFTTAMVQWSLAAQQNKICTLCWLGWLGQICTANCNLKISVSYPEFHFFCHPALNMWCFSSILCGFLQETIFMTKDHQCKKPQNVIGLDRLYLCQNQSSKNIQAEMEIQNHISRELHCIWVFMCLTRQHRI